MNSPFSTKRRHYDTVYGLVPRNSSDIEASTVNKRSNALGFLGTIKSLDPKLVSSAHGKMESMLLTIPRYATRPPLSTVYCDLISKLPDVEFVVATDTPDIVGGWFVKKPTLIEIPNHINFSIWAEDPYVAISNNKGCALVEPYSFRRYGDALIADFVGNGSDIANTQAPLYFQGGNVLVGDDFFLIGADYPAKSLQYVGSVIDQDPGMSSRAQIRNLYRQYLDCDRIISYVGSTLPVPSEQQVYADHYTNNAFIGNEEGTVQPLFHIDMFLTLAGRNSNGAYQILVGDPAMAAETLGTSVPRFGMREIFDNIAKRLSNSGFEVIRNPLPLVYFDAHNTRTWYFATSNNALVEITDSSKKVWLPTYGYGEWEELSATDELNRKIWERLGFDVIMLSDFHPFAENLGAVHCIKKYLKRSEY